MSEVDKAKLDTVQQGALTSIIWHLGDQNGPGANSNTPTPTIFRYSVYSGTGVCTPNQFAVVAQTNNASRPVAIDIYDVSNGHVLATISGITDLVPTLHSTGIISNLPASLAIVACRGYYTGQSAVCTCFAAFLARVPGA